MGRRRGVGRKIRETFLRGLAVVWRGQRRTNCRSTSSRVRRDRQLAAQNADEPPPPGHLPLPRNSPLRTLAPLHNPIPNTNSFLNSLILIPQTLTLPPKPMSSNPNPNNNSNRDPICQSYNSGP